MMRAVHRLRFAPDPASTTRETRIDRYLGRTDHARRGRWASAQDSTGLGNITISLIETSAAAGTIAPLGDAATIWHVLWVRDEDASLVTIAGDTWPIAPGDSVIAPPGEAIVADGGQLAIAINVPHADATVTPPTHGEERFFGYNRQTICCRAGDIRLCRWKLTQPLALADHHPDPVLTLALARDSTIRTSTTIDRLRQGELAVIDPTANPIVTPGGLSYLLTLDREPSGR